MAARTAAVVVAFLVAAALVASPASAEERAPPARDAPLEERVEYLIERWMSEDPNPKALWTFEHAMARDIDFDAAMRTSPRFAEFDGAVQAAFGRPVGGPDEERDEFKAQMDAQIEARRAAAEERKDPVKAAEAIVSGFLADDKTDKEKVWRMERGLKDRLDIIKTMREHPRAEEFKTKVRGIVGREFMSEDAERDADPDLDPSRFRSALDMPATDISGLVRDYLLPHKLFQFARGSSNMVTEGKYREALFLLEEADELLSAWRLQVKRMEAGQAPIDFDDGMNLQVDPSSNFDTGAAFESKMLFRPRKCVTKAVDNAMLRITYIGKLAATDQTFVSTLDRRSGLPFLLGADDNLVALNKGLDGACPLERRLITVPPEDGYGDEGLKDDDGTVVVPPGATLQFYVDVLTVINPMAGEL